MSSEGPRARRSPGSWRKAVSVPDTSFDPFRRVKGRLLLAAIFWLFLAISFLPSPWSWIAVGVVVAAMAGLAWWVIVRRRRGPGPN